MIYKRKKQILRVLFFSLFVLPVFSLNSAYLKQISKFANKAESGNLKKKKFFKNQHKKAMNAGVAGFESDNILVRKESLRLLKALAANGIYAQEVINTAKKCMGFDYSNAVKLNALELFDFLINRNLGYVEAYEVVQNQFLYHKSSFDKCMEDIAVGLIKGAFAVTGALLFKADPKEILDIDKEEKAKLAKMPKDANFSLELLIFLLKRNLYLNEAKVLAKKGLNSIHKPVKDRATKLKYYLSTKKNINF